MGEITAFEWTTFWIAVAALLVAMMALPTVFQMIWGRPKIDLSFELQGGKRLACWLEQPLVTKWLRPLGVRRASVEVHTIVSVEQSQQVIALEPFADLIHVSGARGKFMTVTPSIIANIQVLIALWRDGKCRVWQGGSPVDLPPGDYLAHIVVMYAGSDITSGNRHFTVTASGIEADV